MSDTKLIRLTSGEDVIATLLSEDDESITIENAIVAIPAGKGELGFAPWSPLLSKEVNQLTVSKRFIIYLAEPITQLVDQYKQMFSPIITPSTDIITPAT